LEPPAFEIINSDGNSRVLLICDHASNRVPLALENLGLSHSQLTEHIAWDPGAMLVASALARLLDAPLVASNYSRLVIDCNRPLTSHELIPIQSAGTIIPGNYQLSDLARERRITSFFTPYHDAIEQVIEDRQRQLKKMSKKPLLLLSIHSFTPELDGQTRPWTIGISHKAYQRFARNIFNRLNNQGLVNVGFNQPYPIEEDYDYSIPVHGDGRGIASAMIEIRQDGIQTEPQAIEWAERIALAVNQ
jgi:predicted N-formylglutamate amidohydrolase